MTHPTDGDTCCPLCREAASQQRLTLGHRLIVRCGSCDHRYVARFDEEELRNEYRAAYYADAQDPRLSSWAADHHTVWDALVRQVVDLCPDVASLLDVGAGTGGFLARVHAHDPSVHLSAVEPSEAARSFIAEHLPDVQFPVHDAGDLGAVEQTYDVVTMLQTLEHLEDPVRACRGALRCLRPGGLLLVTVPSRLSLATLLRGRRADCWANNTHLQFFDRAHLMTTLRRAGFRRMRRIVSFGGGQYPGLVARTLQYGLRVVGAATELRFAAWREDGPTVQDP